MSGKFNQTEKAIQTFWQDSENTRAAHNLPDLRANLLNTASDLINNGELQLPARFLEVGAGLKPLSPILYQIQTQSAYFPQTPRMILYDYQYRSKRPDLPEGLDQHVEIRSKGIQTQLQYVEQYLRQGPATVVMESIANYFPADLLLGIADLGQTLCLANCSKVLLGQRDPRSISDPFKWRSVLNSLNFEPVTAVSDQDSIWGIFRKR